MRIHNFLPLLHECLADWVSPPEAAEFARRYHAPMAGALGGVFGDGEEMHSIIRDVEWDTYRAEALRLDPVAEEARVRRHLADVERLVGFELSGDIILFGAFESMDGYARFEEGSHRVFLGVDESHGRGRYLDVLITHELVHVAREARASVWEGFGLSPRMTNREFTNSQPVIEHLAGEGFSCTVSELLVPGEDPWHYAYQEDRAGLERVLAHGAAVDRVVREELRDPDGDYGRLYSPASYRPRLPVFAHYVWAWQWTRRLLREGFGGDVSAMVGACSREWIEDALTFELRGLGP